MDDKMIREELCREDYFKRVLKYGSDLRNVEAFMLCFRDELVFVPEKASWFYYDGKRWVQDTGSIYAMNCAKHLALELHELCRAVKEDEERTALMKKVRRWQEFNVRERLLKDARSMMSVTYASFDCEPWLLNLKNGTYDLRDGKLYAHDPEDYLTKMANAEYIEEMQDKRFNRFLFEIMNGSGALCNYLQRSLGYGLSGENREECLFILYGATTRNGKSTLLDSIENVLGDYAAAVLPETLSQNRTNRSGPSEDIARLKGVRFAAVSEPEQHLEFHAARVKTLTGQDTVNACFLHENSFEFRPQFKIYMNTNYLPKVSDETLFLSRRLRVIPFERHFTQEEQDKTLKAHFRTEDAKSAILWWLLKGYELYTLRGLSEPPEVSAAIEQYALCSNSVGRFVRERLEKKEGAYITSADLYAAYQRWCYDCGETPLAHIPFSKSIKRYGEIKDKRINGKVTKILYDYAFVADVAHDL